MIEQQPEYMPLEEQHNENSKLLRALQPMHFYRRLAEPQHVHKISIDEGKEKRWIDEDWTAHLRQQLVKRDGIPAARLQAGANQQETTSETPASLALLSPSYQPQEAPSNQATPGAQREARLPEDHPPEQPEQRIYTPQKPPRKQ